MSVLGPGWRRALVCSGARQASPQNPEIGREKRERFRHQIDADFPAKPAKMPQSDQ
jgi:hypothetical protein